MVFLAFPLLLLQSSGSLNWQGLGGRGNANKEAGFLEFHRGRQGEGVRFTLLAANPNYDLEFYDESVRVPIESRDAEYVKRRIREKINRTSVTVCLISENTHKSKWVDWELEESHEKGNSIIAMGLKEVARAVLPRLIKEKNLTFHSWDPQRRFWSGQVPESGRVVFHVERPSCDMDSIRSAVEMVLQSLGHQAPR